MSANLNWIDYIFLAIFFFSIIAGFVRGFAKQVISLLTIIVAFVVAILFANPLSQVITHSSTVQGMVNHASNSIGADAAAPVAYAAIAISFGLLFAVVLIIGTIISFIVNLAFQSGILGLGNRLLGALFGFCRGFIINLVIIFVVQLSAWHSAEAWKQSELVRAYQPAVAWLGGIVSPNLKELKEKMGQTWNNMNASMSHASSSVQEYMARK